MFPHMSHGAKTKQGLTCPRGRRRQDARHLPGQTAGLHKVQEMLAWASVQKVGTYIRQGQLPAGLVG
jgi:hypothetical protein